MGKGFFGANSAMMQGLASELGISGVVVEITAEGDGVDVSDDFAAAVGGRLFRLLILELAIGAMGKEKEELDSALTAKNKEIAEKVTEIGALQKRCDRLIEDRGVAAAGAQAQRRRADTAYAEAERLRSQLGKLKKKLNKK